jgi:hypothetical protein
MDLSDDLSGWSSRCIPEIRSFPESSFVSVNFDPASAVTSVLGTLPELQALRTRLAALPGLDLTRTDKL